MGEPLATNAAGIRCVRHPTIRGSLVNWKRWQDHTIPDSLWSFMMFSWHLKGIQLRIFSRQLRTVYISILYPYLASDRKETNKELGALGIAPMRCCHSKMRREGLRCLSTIFLCELGTPGFQHVQPKVCGWLNWSFGTQFWCWNEIFPK